MPYLLSLKKEMPYQRVQRWTSHLWHLQLCGKLSVVSLVDMVTMWCNLWSGVTAALQVNLFDSVDKFMCALSQPLFPSYNEICFQDSSAYPVFYLINNSKILFFLTTHILYLKYRILGLFWLLTQYLLNLTQTFLCSHFVSSGPQWTQQVQPGLSPVQETLLKPAAAPTPVFLVYLLKPCLTGSISVAHSSKTKVLTRLNWDQRFNFQVKDHLF